MMSEKFLGSTPGQENISLALERERELTNLARTTENFLFSIDASKEALQRKKLSLVYDGSFKKAQKLATEIISKGDTLSKSLEISTADYELAKQEIEELVSDLEAIEKELSAAVAELGHELEPEAKVAKEESLEIVGEEQPADLDQVSEEISHYEPLEIEVLRELYKSGDDKVFKTENEKGQKVFKTLKQVKSEIFSVVRDEGFDPERVDRFMHETVERLSEEIRKLKRQERKRISSIHHLEIKEQVNLKYEELLQAVGEFLNTEDKVGEIEEDNNPEALVATVEAPVEHYDTEQKLTETLVRYEQLVMDSDSEEDQKIFDQATTIYKLLKNYHESDEIRAIYDKRRYLNKLLPLLAKLEAKTKVDNQNGEVKDMKRETISPAMVEPPLLTDMVENPHDVLKYEDKRTDWLETKKNYHAKENEYQAAIDQYYNRGLGGKLHAATQGAREILGLRPTLPPDLITMQAEYKKLRTEYAVALDGAMLARSKQKNNKAFDLNTQTSKEAFGEKFILRPNQELLALQEKSILSPEAKKRVERALEILAKHKWNTRLGMLAVGGVTAVGAGAGAVALGVGWQAGRMALGIGIGTGGGFLAKEATQGSVDSARQEVGNAKSVAQKNFSLADLETLEKSLEAAELNRRRAEKRQKAALVGAAVASGVAAYNTGGFVESTIEGSEIAKDTDVNNRQNLKNDNFTPEDSEKINRLVGNENHSQKVEGPEISQVPEMITVIDRVTVPHYRIDGTVDTETILSNITVSGNSMAVLTPETKLSVNQFLKMAVNDLLADLPKMSEANLESNLLAKLESRYGNASWWDEAGITKVDIGEIETSSSPIAETEVLEAAEATSALLENSDSTSNPHAEIHTHEYTVEKGDDVWSILKNNFASDLKSLSPAEQNELLDTLLDKVRSDDELRQSIGLKSNDIDLIYPNEKLELSEVGAELQKMIANLAPAEAVEFTKSAPIHVKLIDVEDSLTVPIKVIEDPIIVSETPVNTKPELTTVEPDPAVVNEIKSPEVIPPPRPFSLDGNYSTTPQYKEYILNQFGSERAFSQLLEKSIISFDDETYDIFERSSFLGGNNYQSPYQFMSDKTLEEIAEFERLPNAEIRNVMAENDMKYDTYLAWLDKIDEMKQNLPHTNQTKLSDLFTRYVVETNLPQVNPLTRKIV